MTIVTWNIITVGPDGSIFLLSATGDDTSGHINSLDAVNHDVNPHVVGAWYQRGNQVPVLLPDNGDGTHGVTVPAIAADGTPGTASYVPPATVKWGSDRFDIALIS